MDIIHHHEQQQTADEDHQFSKAHSADDPRHVNTAMNLLLLGSASGLLLHWLVWARTGGSLGMLIWTVFSCSAVLWLNRHQSAAWLRELVCWTALMSTAASFVVLRDADQVMLLMYLVMALCLGMIFYRSRGDTLRNATIPLVVVTTLRLPARILLSLFPAADTVIKSRWHSGRQLSAVLRGLLLAAPLLFVFVMLFASADAVFSQQLDRIGRFLGELTPSSPLISLMLIVLATGLLSCSLLQNTYPVVARRTSQPHGLWPGLGIRLGSAETAIVMGSLAMLFGTFVLLQASYLFGGRELIEARSGLTLADYARRGFFELLTVAALTLGLLMALASTQCHQTLFRRLGGVLIVCVMIMLLSALYRLNLYIEQFGLTMARLVALAVMLWLASGLLWFAVTVLRGNACGFLAGLILSSVVCCLLLAVINPAARVTEMNIKHARTSAMPLDIDYLNGLGADVVPIVLASLSESAPSEVSCHVARHTFAHWRSVSTDWRDWNAARAAARKAVNRQLETCQ